MPTRILISGASIAGPALAYWLLRANCAVTVVERSRVLRSEGQGVDVRDTAREVLKRMGIFEQIRDRSSGEEGMSFVDSENRAFARFGVDLESGMGDSATSDIEILRGELAGILYDVTAADGSREGGVEYVFGDWVESYREREGVVDVSFKNGGERTFDLVVAADGIGSKIREMAFGKKASQVRSLGSYISYFSIPKGEADTMWARVHWVKGGRCLVQRPDNHGRTRAFMMFTAYEKTDPRLARFEKASKASISEQKALVQELFQDADWEASRMLEGMQGSNDFYMQHVAQVRLPRWSRGRVAVVGDAGYAASPFSGMGTSIAFLGAYVLAGEISKRLDDIPAALEEYERVLRPYVENLQKLAPGTPWIVQPQTVLGIRVLETVIWAASLIQGTWIVPILSKLAAYLPIPGDVPFKLPDYEAFR